MAVVDIVRKLAEPIAEAQQVVLWDIEFVKEGSEYFLRIYIDHPDGINIDQCEAFSRTIDPLLDEADPIEQSYSLEVCSAGLIRELKTESHIRTFLGHTAEIHLYRAKDGLKKVFDGELTACDSEQVTVTVDGTAYVLSRKEIAQIKIDLI